MEKIPKESVRLRGMAKSVGKDFALTIGIFSDRFALRLSDWGVPSGDSRIPTVKLKIPGKAFLKSESRTSVTFKL